MKASLKASGFSQRATARIISPHIGTMTDCLTAAPEDLVMAGASSDEGLTAETYNLKRSQDGH